MADTPDATRNLKSRLRDLKKLYAQDMIGREEMCRVSDMLEEYERYSKATSIAKEIYGDYEPIPYMPGSVKVKYYKDNMPPRKKPDHEVELVKNIIADVLTNKLDCKRCANQDAYRLEFGADIPRYLVIQGSLSPVVEYLEKIKKELCGVIDFAIKEMRERNEGN